MGRTEMNERMTVVNNESKRDVQKKTAMPI
jgi:hypothetical protein